MAIYKNREVSIFGPNTQANTPETINIIYKDGTRENVDVGGLLFTEEEKKNLVKNHPSKFEDVRTVSDSDVEAVRAGVAPSFDPSYRAAAEAQVRREKQDELTKQNQDKAKAEAQKSVNEDMKKKPSDNMQTPMNTNPNKGIVAGKQK